CPTARRDSPRPTSSWAGWRGSATTESADRDGAHLTIDRTAIDKTAAVIRPHVRVTPLLALSGADFGLAAFPLSLKLELFQHAGSFKTRGAFANLLLRQVPPAAVVAGRPRGRAAAGAGQNLRADGVLARKDPPHPRVRRRPGGRRRALRRRAGRERRVGDAHRCVARTRLRSARDIAGPGHARTGDRGAGPRP